MDKSLMQAGIKDCNKGKLEHTRRFPTYWKYSKRKPFNTEYPEGYLNCLRPQMQKQLSELQTKGILATDQEYIIKEMESSFAKMQKRLKKKRILKEKRHDEWSKRDAFEEDGLDD